MNPTILGVIGPGFLNQVPTLLGCWVSGFRSSGLLGGVVLGRQEPFCRFRSPRV